MLNLEFRKISLEFLEIKKDFYFIFILLSAIIKKFQMITQGYQNRDDIRRLNGIVNKTVCEVEELYVKLQKMKQRLPKPVPHIETHGLSPVDSGSFEYNFTITIDPDSNSTWITTLNFAWTKYVINDSCSHLNIPCDEKKLCECQDIYGVSQNTKRRLKFLIEIELLPEVSHFINENFAPNIPLPVLDFHDTTINNLIPEEIRPHNNIDVVLYRNGDIENLPFSPSLSGILTRFELRFSADGSVSYKLTGNTTSGDIRRFQFNVTESRFIRYYTILEVP